jgi:Flp pilus assembly protein TadG
MDRVDRTTAVVTTTLTTVECLKPILFSRRKGRLGGQTTVEFALICLPFFIILFTIIDFSEIYFYENSVQNALREACRFATSGRVLQTTNTDGSPAYETNSSGVVVPKAIQDTESREASRNECIRYWFLSNCVLRNFPLSNIVITSAPTLPGVPARVETNAIANGPSYLILLQTNGLAAIPGPGNANDYIQITATYQVSTITPLMSYMSGYSGVGSVFPVHVSAIVKNEPALLNFQHTNMYSDEP